MPWMNHRARLIGAPSVLKSLVAEDVPAELLRVIREGWVERDGVRVLIAWHDSYHGSTERFRSVRGYEAAINGRAIPDHDLPNVKSAARGRLLRRGLAFGWAALYQQSIDLPEVAMISEISLASMLFDAETWTGNVTFYTAGDAAAWPDEHQVDGDQVVVLLRTEDCLTPLA